MNTYEDYMIARNDARADRKGGRGRKTAYREIVEAIRLNAVGEAEALRAKGDLIGADLMERAEAGLYADASDYDGCIDAGLRSSDELRAHIESRHGIEIDSLDHGDGADAPDLDEFYDSLFEFEFQRKRFEADNFEAYTQFERVELCECRECPPDSCECLKCPHCDAPKGHLASQRRAQARRLWERMQDMKLDLVPACVDVTDAEVEGGDPHVNFADAWERWQEARDTGREIDRAWAASAMADAVTQLDTLPWHGRARWSQRQKLMTALAETASWAWEGLGHPDKPRLDRWKDVYAIEYASDDSAALARIYPNTALRDADVAKRKAQIEAHAIGEGPKPDGDHLFAIDGYELIERGAGDTPDLADPPPVRCGHAHGGTAHLTGWA